MYKSWYYILNVNLDNQIPILAVDCSWGKWLDEKPCNVSCGQKHAFGIKKMKRTHKWESHNGGKECTGDSRKTEECTDDCSGKYYF